MSGTCQHSLDKKLVTVLIFVSKNRLEFMDQHKTFVSEELNSVFSLKINHRLSYVSLSGQLQGTGRARMCRRAAVANAAAATSLVACLWAWAVLVVVDNIFLRTETN